MGMEVQANFTLREGHLCTTGNLWLCVVCLKVNRGAPCLGLVVGEGFLKEKMLS